MSYEAVIKAIEAERLQEGLKGYYDTESYNTAIDDAITAIRNLTPPAPGVVTAKIIEDKSRPYYFPDEADHQSQTQQQLDAAREALTEARSLIALGIDEPESLKMIDDALALLDKEQADADPQDTERSG